jgi:maltooligosyltrehalose trehalohydrolase
MRTVSRRFPIGAEVTSQGTSFRVWAPRRKAVTVVGKSGDASFEQPLDREKEGYFSGVVFPAKAGAT